MAVRGMIVGALVLMSAPCFAQGTDEQRAACMEDAMRYCGDKIMSGETAIEKCLESRLPALTPACRRQFVDTPNPPGR